VRGTKTGVLTQVHDETGVAAVKVILAAEQRCRDTTVERKGENNPAAILLPIADSKNKKATLARWLNCMIFIIKSGGPCWV
jgi:hypothetical protein